MPTVVIIHAAEDALPARALAEKLRQAKLTPVIEKPLGNETRDAVKGAAVCIALWSPRSISQPALAEDAAFARSKSKLIHATMQNVQAPEQFRKDTPVDLTGWRGEDNFQGWLDLAKLVTSKAGVAPLPPPAPRPPSGFFQPGRVDPALEASVKPAPNQAGLKRPDRPRAQLPEVKHGGQANVDLPMRGAAQQPPPRQAAAPRRQAAQGGRPASPDAAPKKGGGMGLIIGIVVFILVAAGGGAGYYFWNQQQNTQSAGQDAAPSPADIQRDFETARAEDTVQALEGFLAAHPNSPYELMARGRIAELQGAPAAPAAAPVVEEPAAPETPAAPDPAPTGAGAAGPESLAPPTPEPEVSTEPESAPSN